MAISEIEKVLTVFQGVATRDVEMATRYVNPENYTEHNPRAADGIGGLREYIRHLPREDHYSVTRAFQDGSYVFTHGDGLILGQNIFFEVFRFEESLIVEHWVFAAKEAPPNESGHTQTDGPIQAKPSEDTEENKSFVQHYYTTIHILRDDGKIPGYFSGDQCIRHEPGVRDGVTEFKRDLERLIKNRSIDEIKFVLGQGDFVFIAARGSHKTAPCVYVDLYRVENGKIAERWGFSEPVPPQEKWKNSNSML